MAKRVCCLYRVSTDKQVDYDSNHEADIPMQRKACRKFAEQMGWEIVHEEQEDGVSGHKVRAENRDKIQIIKELARKKQFDILLVFMFDRIGRIADETPFVVEWFVKNNIEVWSTQEGEQRFDNHIDKLLNYIRFWQADGESEKTSIRTKTSLGQMVEEGHFKGGTAAFGYDLVRSGRLNKKKHELYDLKINEAEADIVRMIFDKYTTEGCGAQRITTWLNEQGYRARTGKMWHPATIRGILHNLTYTGVLRSGESRSEIIPELQIIPVEQFERTQEILKARSEKTLSECKVPLNTRGQSLLAGIAYCGHCGSKLTLTTSGRYRKRTDGTIKESTRIRYACYGKTRKQTDCDGQTGYTMHILDDIIDKIVRDIFSKMKGVSKNDLVMIRYTDELEQRKMRLTALKSKYAKEADNLNILKSEVIKCIRGESKFSQEMLSSLITESEVKCSRLLNMCEDAEKEVSDSENVLKDLSATFDELVSWAELYDDAEFAQKKMIVNCLIRRVDVYRDYKLKINFNFDFQQFINGIDSVV
ncbi:MAG: recombinase family protein [Clostridia bacterium]|nr:recombinase family protein [Clostridia bacterium]